MTQQQFQDIAAAWCAAGGPYSPPEVRTFGNYEVTCVCTGYTHPIMGAVRSFRYLESDMPGIEAHFSKSQPEPFGSVPFGNWRLDWSDRDARAAMAAQGKCVAIRDSYRHKWDLDGRGADNDPEYVASKERVLCHLAALNLRYEGHFGVSGLGLIYKRLTH